MFFQEPGELFREPRPFCYQTGIYIQHATVAIRTEPAPATDVQDQLLVAYGEVIQDCFLGEPLRRVVLRLFNAVVTLIKVQMKRRDLGFGSVSIILISITSNSRQLRELIVLVNLESMNAELIKLGLSRSERAIRLNKMAIEQLRVLNESDERKLLQG